MAIGRGDWYDYCDDGREYFRLRFAFPTYVDSNGVWISIRNRGKRWCVDHYVEGTQMSDDRLLPETWAVICSG